VSAASGRRRDGRGEKSRKCSIGLVGRLAALLVLAFAVALYLRTRRSASVTVYEPAEELRTKLAQSRAFGEEPAPEPTIEHDLDVRRRDVHERARGAIDELS
jgi:hypothetical protein